MNFDKTLDNAQPIIEHKHAFAASPKHGETFKLAEALKPKTSVLEVCKAMGFAYPPLLLTYKGQASGALVRQELHL